MSFPHLGSKGSGINPIGKAQELTLTADRGFFDETGTAAGTYHGYPMPAAAGSYAVSGTAANLLEGHVLSASPGAISWSGTAAGEFVGYYLNAQAGSVAETGTDANLNYSTNPTAVALSQTQVKRNDYPRAFSPAVFGKRKFNFVNEFRVLADPGSYNLVGTDASFQATQVGASINQRIKTKYAWPRPFAPSPWGHLTGQRSVNRIGGSSTTYFINADPGNIVWTGTDLTFRVGHVIAANVGTWNWNTVAANLNKGFTLAATPGTTTLAGTDVTFKVMMPAGVGSWLITAPAAVDLFYSNAPTNRGAMALLGVG